MSKALNVPEKPILSMFEMFQIKDHSQRKYREGWERAFGNQEAYKELEGQSPFHAVEVKETKVNA